MNHLNQKKKAVTHKIFLLTGLLLFAPALMLLSQKVAEAAIYGMVADIANPIVMSSDDINMTGNGDPDTLDIGIAAGSGGKAFLEADIKITDAIQASGIEAKSSGQVYVIGNVTVEGNNADIAKSNIIGVSARPSDPIFVDISGNIKVTGFGEESYSVIGAVLGGGELKVGGNIEVYGPNKSAGLIIRNGASADIGGNIYAEGENAYALQAESGSQTIVGGNVTTKGASSLAAWLSSSNADIKGNVSANGDNSRALSFYESEATIGGNVTALGESVKTAWIYQSSADITGNVLASGNKSYALDLTSSDITVGGDVTALGESAYTAMMWYSSADIAGNVLADGKDSSAVEMYFSDATIGGSVTALGEGTSAIWMYDSSIEITGDVLAEGKSSTALEAQYYSDATIGGNVMALGESARAAYIATSNVSIAGNVLANGLSAIALNAYRSNTIVGGNVEAIGEGTRAAYLRYSSADITGNVQSEGKNSTALEMWGSPEWESDVTIGGSVVALGDNAKAADIRNASADITGNILAEGNKATALKMNGGNYGAYAAVGGSVEALGEEVIAARIDYASADITGNILAKGKNAHALEISISEATIGGSVAAEGNSALAAWINDSSVDIARGVQVSGDNSIAVYATNYSDATITGGITAAGSETTAILSAYSTVKVNDGVINVSGDNSTAIKLYWGGTVELNDVTTIADSRGLLLHTESGGVLTAETSTLSGDIINENNNDPDWTLQITLDDTSTLTGTVTDAGNDAITNLTIADSGSVWYLTGDSLLNGALDNNGTVSFANNSAFTTLTVADLFSSGSADDTFVMRADIVGQVADQLVVTGAMNGSTHNITVLNQGNLNTDGSEVTQLVDTADSSGVFRLTNDVELGGWLYGLRQESGGLSSVWELYGLGEITSAVDGGANTFLASYLLAYVETQTLIQRLGDLRETPHLSGLWFKGHAGKFEVESGNYVKAFDMDYWGVQLGYDRKIETNWDGDFYAGVMFGYSNGDLSLAFGDGNADSKTLGVYGTFIHPNGFFADLVLKYQWIDNDFKVLDSAGGILNSDGLSTGGFGASLELGQRVHFAQGKTSGWYIEPQIQLSYMRQDGGDVTLSNGLRVGAEPFTSVLGRLGMLVGYETEKTNFYAKVSKVKEFDGKMTIIANSSSFGETAGGSWWSYGLGFTSKINDRNSLYLDIERASGGFFEQKWSVQAGWRVLF